MRALALLALVSVPVLAQDRPSEADLFGAPDAEPVDAGVAAAPAASPSPVDAGPAAPHTAASDRDVAQLSGPALFDKFESKDVSTDPLKVGGSLLMTAQFAFPEGKAAELGTVSVPMVMDTFIDARPNDRVRAMAVGRLQFDPTRQLGAATTSAATSGSIGLTSSTASNPSVALDQLWLRFDLARTLYFTVGRQKVRWGTSHIWYPTDFLNSQPKDALNPFDARLGVNMVKVHLPIESLGWNFYGYGILDNIDLSATTPNVTIERLGGALRAEFVVGPAEFSASGVWMKGRRPRYAVDFSTALGPVDIYGEAAFRSGKDFLLFNVPGDLTAENAISEAIAVADTKHYGDGIVVQASGGLTWQFNYTDKNTLMVSAEYYYNPVGYDRPEGYLVQTFVPPILAAITPKDSPVPTLDPSQRAPLYQGKHSFAVIVASPTIPGAEWISLTASNIVRINDPSGLFRFDASFRVLTYLTVQVFSQVFYGQSGGELRFAVPKKVVNDLANFSPTDQQDQVRSQLKPLIYPPLLQVGALLRVSL